MNDAAKSARDYGQKKAGKIGGMILGGGARVSASIATFAGGLFVDTAIFTAVSLALVGGTVGGIAYGAYQGGKRAVGTAALFGNFIRHAITQNIEDIPNKIVKANAQSTYQKLLTTYLNESAEHSISAISSSNRQPEKVTLAFKEVEGKVTELSQNIMNAITPQELEKAVEAYKEQVDAWHADKDLLKINSLTALDTMNVKFIQEAEKLVALEKKKVSKELTQKDNDTKFSKLPGVKQMRENINTLMKPYRGMKAAVKTYMNKGKSNNKEL